MAYTANTEPPTIFHKWVAISMIASVLQRKCFAQWESRVYPNMYIILCAPSGCRKGTAMRSGTQLVAKFPEVRLAADNVTREKLIMDLDESLQQVEYSDPALGTCVHCSLTILSEELVVFLGRPAVNPSDATFMSTLTQWFDCQDIWHYRTKTSGESTIHGVWFNLLGATTPDLVKACLPTEAIGSGFTGRIIWVYANRKRHKVPFPFKTQDEIDLEIDLQHDLERMLMLNGEFKMTKEFLEAYEHWYVHEDNGRTPLDQDPNFVGYCDRRAVHLRKLSMVMSAARSDDMIITAADFQRAKDFLQEAERKMPNVYRNYGRNELAQLNNNMLAYLSTNKVVSVEEMHSRFMQDIDIVALTKWLHSLAEIKVIRFDNDSHRGIIITWIGKTVTHEEGQ